jgi:putative FmdB family regulatory protein
MPIYEFQCRACGREFEELFRSSGAVKPPACPKCHSRKTERQFSVFGMSGGSAGKSESSSGASCGGCRRSSCAGCGH